MPLHSIESEPLRSRCKSLLESLELWLRSIINYELTNKYGSDYVNATRINGERIINTKIFRNMDTKRKNNEMNYPRYIDALDLDDAIKIICNPELYRECFSKPLKIIYPEGHEEARTFLERLIEPRNKLSHANPISIREAERVICYTNDFIYGLKEYFRNENMENEYNAPTIVKISDSLGRVFYSSNILRYRSGRGFVRSDSAVLYSEDRLSIEVEIDSSFSEDSYLIKWSIPASLNMKMSGNKICIDIEKKHVGQSFCISCIVISNKEWHRLGDCDDRVEIEYKVLPLADD